MSKAYHVRYTPYDLSKDILGFCTQFTSYAAYEEDKGRGDQSSLHYHIYIETALTKKTITNRLVAHFSVPTGIRGQANAYYMVKEIEHPQFQLGYVAKANKKVCATYAHEFIEAARIHYEEKRYKGTTLAPTNTVHEQPERSEGNGYKCSLDDIYVEYKEYMKNKLRKVDYQITTQWLKNQSRPFWYEKSVSGLQPVGSTANRFVASFYYEYITRLQIPQDDATDLQFGAVGY